ncbi:MAG: hypothetical protein ACYDH4_05150 [Candidatus Cryosericum sp.]
MIPSFVPRQANPIDYAYVSGSFSVRRGLLIPVPELRAASATGKTNSLFAALNRGAYAPIGSDMSAGDVLARVESAWQAFLAQASRDLPERFLPYVLAALDEKEYAKAGLAEALLGGDAEVRTDGTSSEYAAYCVRIKTEGSSPELLKESVFGAALSEGLKAAEAGASASDAQTVFDFSFETTMDGLARVYGHPAVIAYMDGLLKLMLAGHALKIKLRSTSGVGAPLERLLPFLQPDIRVSLAGIVQRILSISWDTLQPVDLVPEASMYVLTVGRRCAPEERIQMLEDALESWLVGRPEATGSDPYGVAVVFAYLMDFRREVWSLRRLLKAAASSGPHVDVSGGAL